jgi:Tol biopolymer transport system component
MSKRRRAKSSIVGSRPGSGRSGKALFGLVCTCVLALGALLGSGASAVAAEACPNEQLRQENNSLSLPDCRAYEQVSATDKAGNDAGPINVPNAGNYPPMALATESDDGNGYAYGSMGAFNGAESGWPVSYVARRTGTGWVSAPASPATNGKENASNPQAYSGDLNVTAFTYIRGSGPYGQGPGLYVREPDGSFTWASPGVKTFVAYRGASADGSRQVYENSEELLSGVPAPPVGTAHIYEWSEGSLRLVDLLPGETRPPKGAVVGAGGNASPNSSIGNARHAVSQTGSSVVFSSPASTKSTSAEPTQVYVRIDGTRTVQASASQCTRTAPEPVCSAPAVASYEDAATDGSRVLFITTQQLINEDEDTVADLYSYDVANGTLTRLSAGLGGATHVLGSSADAEVVYFTVSSDHKLYVFDHGTVRLIAEGTMGSSQCPSTMSITPSGSALAFVTNFPLTPASGTAGPSGLYRYDNVGSGTLTLVAARGPAGVPSLGNQGCVGNHALSDDGSYLAFSTPEPLVEADQNKLSDVYLWRDGEVSLISSGTGEGTVGGANFIGISPSGHDLYFTSFDRLAPTDTDISQDVYDARVDGGFALAGESPPCAGDACRGSGSRSNGSPTAGTVGFAGAGNANGKSTATIAVGAAVKGSVATLRVRVPSAGAITASGKSVRRATRTTRKAGTAVLRVTLTKRAKQTLEKRAQSAARRRDHLRQTHRLTPKARSKLARMASLRTSVRVTFAPTDGPRSAKRVVVTFRSH